MWYVIQTVAGKEEELLLFIRTLLCREYFENCFVIRVEWLKRLSGEWQLQVRALFPGYVFIETEDPERIYLEMKAVPRFSRLLGNSRNEFIPVNEEEERFLRLLISNANQDQNLYEAVVKLTHVKTDENGKIISVIGALAYFEKEIVRVKLHKRYAIVKTRMLGEERTLIFGIWLEKDGK